MTRSDWLLVAIVASAPFLLMGLRLLLVSGEQIRVRVGLKGKTVRVINLEAVDGSVATVPFERGKAQLEVKQGAIRLLPMPGSICPRKICSHTGWIRRPGESIICVMNRLVIRLTGEAPGRLMQLLIKRVVRGRGMRKTDPCIPATFFPGSKSDAFCI